MRKWINTNIYYYGVHCYSRFQVTNVQAAEERNPIYNPTNPTEEIYPIENTGTPEKWKKQMKVLLLAKRKRKKVAKTLVKSDNQ